MVFIKDEINRLREKLLNDITDIDVYLYNYIRGNENNTDIVIPNNFRELTPIDLNALLKAAIISRGKEFATKHAILIEKLS